jgi:phosphohistidine swiveling domain-containing protein
MSVRFSTKGQTLAELRTQVRVGEVLPLILVSHGEWVRNPDVVSAWVVGELGDGPYIVRSSSRREDQTVESMAGAFLSVLDVHPANLSSAIDRVFESYEGVPADDEVLVQPMLGEVVRSGVVFSHDPNTCSPYRTVNWHDGADTSRVTGGGGGRLWQQVTGCNRSGPAWLTRVFDLVDEVQQLTGGGPIDCEFAFTGSSGAETLWLLQARPLVLGEEPESPETLGVRVDLIRDRVERGMRPHPFLGGSRTVYGVMPDWNPAEIIGVRPRPLALSLYRELITDSIWAYQRHNYGYRNLRSFPLMTHFLGQPYIDVRVSFNSFIPADLSVELADRLVEHYLSKLIREPSLHDKVEFEVVLTCYSFELPDRLRRLRNSGFSTTDCEDLTSALRHLTNRIIHPTEGLWKEDAARVVNLARRREQLFATSGEPLERVYWLIEDGKRYGTLPFAGLARAGFIAVQILRSLVSAGVLSDQDIEEFMTSLSTISSNMVDDRRNMAREEFLAKYGHLRPGTYDICSLRYDEAPNMYFDWSEESSTIRKNKSFALTRHQESAIELLLREHGLDSTPRDLLHFCRSAIELRESSKFEFTRNLSDAMKMLVEFGAGLGFSRQDMSFCDLPTIYEVYRSAADARSSVARSIEEGRRLYEESRHLNLPPLIVDPEDVIGFEIPEAVPNFITQRSIVASVVKTSDLDRLRGSIVAIPSADPGYDWLFSRGIAGLITEWGGANSHMAIRAGELGLPAVIGAGELLYRRWSNARRLSIDCALRRVEIIE